MLLPPLKKRDVAVLEEEHRRLTFARNEVNEIANQMGAAVAFADVLERLDHALSEIEGEVASRAAA